MSLFDWFNMMIIIQANVSTQQYNKTTLIKNNQKWFVMRLVTLSKL